jgi:hypothetical protein
MRFRFVHVFQTRDSSVLSLNGGEQGDVDIELNVPAHHLLGVAEEKHEVHQSK